MKIEERKMALENLANGVVFLDLDGDACQKINLIADPGQCKAVLLSSGVVLTFDSDMQVIYCPHATLSLG